MKLKLKDLIVIDDNINLDEYIEFREYVKKYMSHPEWLGSFTKDELNRLIKIGAKIWIYYIGKVPVCSMMVNPKYVGNNYNIKCY